MDETRDPLLCKRSDTVSTAINKMASDRTGCVLVVDEDSSLVGVFTEHDVLMRVLGKGASLFDKLEDHMTPNPVTASPTDSLWHAIKQMDHGRRRHLPIVADGRPVKILSSRSLVRHFAELFPAEILNLPPDHNQLYDAPDGA